MHQYDKSLVWFRRDLRSFDHAALYHALKSSNTVYCCFIFDDDILETLPRADRRVEFIHVSVAELAHDLAMRGGQLIVRRARAVVLPHLPVEEPQRRERDGLPAPGPRPTRQHERSPVLRARLE